MNEQAPPPPPPPPPSPAPAPAPEETLDLGNLPDILGYQLRRAQIAAFQRFAEIVGPDGLRPGWYGLLVIVARNEGLSQVRLARALGVDGSTMVALIDRMSSAGWIRRERSPTDRRTHALYLTGAGRRLLETATVKIRAYEDELAARLDAGERAELLRLLRKLNGI